MEEDGTTEVNTQDNASSPPINMQAEEEEEEDIDLLEKEILEREEEDSAADDEMYEKDEDNTGSSWQEGSKKKTKKRKNIRQLMTEDELAEETRLEQEREKERIQRLRELHEKSVAETRRKKSAEGRSVQRSAEHVILVDDSDGEGDLSAHNSRNTQPTVITLSSDESDEDEEKPLTGYDDTMAFVGGMHTDDSKNVCDSEMRVLVNVNHPPDEKDIFLTAKLAQCVKSHQIGGIRFLYDNIIESVSRFNTSPGFGCILAHTMGLGKTLQTISFVDCCLRNTPTNTVLIVVPVNVIQNWLNEFDMWVPNSVPDDESSKRIYPVHVVNDSLKTFDARATLIKKWNEIGGVMILGYEMFRLLALTEPSYAVSRKLCRKRRKRGAGPQAEVCDIDEEEFYMDLLKATQRSLLNPGPDIIVCDEGHRIKNAHATISKALKKIKTRRRIVLTGYPLQNNLEEYWCMVDFVRPNFLGTKSEFNNMFVRPIENGQCVDSTPKDTQLMKFRSHVLHSLLEGFVQRRDQSILQHTLQSKTEYVLCVKMTSLQRRLLKRFTTEMEREGGVNPIYAFTVLTKVWNHPDVLQDVLASSKMDDLDVDLPKSSTKLSLEWAKEELAEARRGAVEDGSKMVLLLGLIEESVALGDKVVVFSQSLLTLSLVERFLQQRDVPIHGNKTDKTDIRCYLNNNSASPEYPPAKWTKNKHYFRLDGSTNSQDREKLIKQFNKKSDSALLFLISTRAGSLGVNLIGSNRVIIMDVSWNPCHDAQAVCRIYRYGQTKPSYVYRFVAENTLERTIYNKQITKQGMSSRVVDEQNVEKQFSSAEIVSSADNLEMLPNNPDEETYRWEESLPNITDVVLRNVLQRNGDLLTSAPFTHQSLLIENKNERLTQEEKMLAKKSYQYEKQMNKTFGNYSNYSKPVNRVTPMCKPCVLPKDATPSTTADWDKSATLEQFAEKYNTQNWSSLIKPLSPVQQSPKEAVHAKPQEAVQPTTQDVIQPTPRPQPRKQAPSKPRSILPAPQVPPVPPQYLMTQLPQQPSLKLPLPRTVPNVFSNNSKRPRRPSKALVSSVRPMEASTQAILSRGEGGKCTYKVPISRSTSSHTKDSIKQTSITDALRNIEEVVIEPPTVIVQRIIEQNEHLRRQVQLQSVLSNKEHPPQNFFSLNAANALSNQASYFVNEVNKQTASIQHPQNSVDNLQNNVSTVPTEALYNSGSTTSDNKYVKHCGNGNNGGSERPSKKKTSKKPTISAADDRQVVYQAIPAQALQSNQGYQLLIPMPDQNSSLSSGQLSSTSTEQQIVAGSAKVFGGNQPVLIQNQAAPVIQMSLGNKPVYLVSQPSNISQVHTGQPPQTTTVQSLDTISSSQTVDQYHGQTSDHAAEYSPDQSPGGVQQTPPPTLLSPGNYQQAVQPHQVLIQPHHHAVGGMPQHMAYHPQYLPYFPGSQFMQPRMQQPQNMYVQPSPIQRVQQRPKIKPKPKKAPSRPKKNILADSIDARVSVQMQANILAQQKQRRLIQMPHESNLPRPTYPHLQQYPGQMSHPTQHSFYGAQTRATLQGLHPSASTPEDIARNYQNNLYKQHMLQYQNSLNAKPGLDLQYGFPNAPISPLSGHYPYQQSVFSPASSEMGNIVKTHEKKSDDRKPPAKRKSRKKTDDADNRLNIHIHSPTSFPAVKKQKKSTTKKSAEFPYSAEPAQSGLTPRSRVMAAPHCTPHLYQNMVHLYRQHYPDIQQEQLWNSSYQAEPERTGSPQSGDEMDVNRFLNIPVKTEPAVS